MQHWRMSFVYEDTGSFIVFISWCMTPCCCLLLLPSVDDTCNCLFGQWLPSLIWQPNPCNDFLIGFLLDAALNCMILQKFSLRAHPPTMWMSIWCNWCQRQVKVVVPFLMLSSSFLFGCQKSLSGEIKMTGQLEILLPLANSTLFMLLIWSSYLFLFFQSNKLDNGGPCFCIPVLDTGSSPCDSSFVNWDTAPFATMDLNDALPTTFWCWCCLPWRCSPKQLLSHQTKLHQRSLWCCGGRTSVLSCVERNHHVVTSAILLPALTRQSLALVLRNQTRSKGISACAVVSSRLKTQHLMLNT